MKKHYHGSRDILLTRLAELRKSKKWSMQETADCLGIAKSTYAGYESGYREPSLQALIQIAELFDTTVDYLLNRDYDKLPNMELSEQLSTKAWILSLDGVPLTKEETIDFIAFLRTKRDLKKPTN